MGIAWKDSTSSLVLHHHRQQERAYVEHTIITNLERISSAHWGRWRTDTSEIVDPIGVDKNMVCVKRWLDPAYRQKGPTCKRSNLIWKKVICKITCLLINLLPGTKNSFYLLDFSNSWDIDSCIPNNFHHIFMSFSNPLFWHSIHFLFLCFFYISCIFWCFELIQALRCHNICLKQQACLFLHYIYNPLYILFCFTFYRKRTYSVRSTNILGITFVSFLKKQEKCVPKTVARPAATIN